jgi:hypothetical protein
LEKLCLVSEIEKIKDFSGFVLPREATFIFAMFPVVVCFQDTERDVRTIRIKYMDRQ